MDPAWLRDIGIAAILLGLSAFLAWRYSRTDIDPDWSMFNLASFTGSWYGRDFADCKTPGIHLWYWAIAKIVGPDIVRVRFTHHFLVGGCSVGIWLLSGDFWAALAFAMLINSGWLLAFHGNVGQQPAALITLALLSHQPGWATVLWISAVFFEPKLLPSFVIYALFVGWWWILPLGWLAIFSVLLLKRMGWAWFDWVWESSVTIPARMAKARKPWAWMPWFTSSGALYLLPWVLAGLWFRPDFLYWLPILTYISVISLGKVVRQNHLIPVIPWIVTAGSPGAVVLALVITDIVSSGFYVGDIWNRFYWGLKQLNAEAKAAGLWLRDKTGTLWVNNLHSGVYIYARKRVPYGLAEQIEINGVAIERREVMKQQFKQHPPDWVVNSDQSVVQFKGVGYQRVATAGSLEIWNQKVRKDGKV